MAALTPALRPRPKFSVKLARSWAYRRRGRRTSADHRCFARRALSANGQGRARNWRQRAAWPGYRRAARDSGSGARALFGGLSILAACEKDLSVHVMYERYTRGDQSSPLWEILQVTWTDVCEICVLSTIPRLAEERACISWTAFNLRTLSQYTMFRAVQLSPQLSKQATLASTASLTT